MNRVSRVTGISMESILIIARLDEMGVLSLKEGQTLLNLAQAVDDMSTLEKVY